MICNRSNEIKVGGSWNTCLVRRVLFMHVHKYIPRTAIETRTRDDSKIECMVNKFVPDCRALSFIYLHMASQQQEVLDALDYALLH